MRSASVAGRLCLAALLLVLASGAAAQQLRPVGDFTFFARDGVSEIMGLLVFGSDPRAPAARISIPGQQSLVFQSMRLDGRTVTLSEQAGDAVIELVLVFDTDSTFSGTWRMGDQQGPVSGRRGILPGAVEPSCREYAVDPPLLCSCHGSNLSRVGASGKPGAIHCVRKCMEWLGRVNADEQVNSPLQVLGKVLREYMDLDVDHDPWKQGRDRILQCLAESGLAYTHGGHVHHALGAAPARNLRDLIKARDLEAVNREFERALNSVQEDPPAGVTAASAILESLFKVYIEDEGLELPSTQTLKPLWDVVQKHLGLHPSKVEDGDLKRILGGLASIIDGIGALRTHAGSAHGRGRSSYRLAPRHARLAIHAASTLACFVLESWDARTKTSAGGTA